MSLPRIPAVDRLSIRVKLYLGFGTILALLAGVAATAVWGTSNVTASADEVDTVVSQKLLIAKEMSAAADPDAWSGVAVASPAIWPAFADVWVGDAFDGAADFARNDVFAGSVRLERTRVWIGCGRSDPFYANARRLAASIPGARTDWADGGHDQCLWRLVARRQMAFAVSALGV